MKHGALRVVHVYKDIFPVVGGIENHVRVLCRELRAYADLDLRILVTSPDRHTRAGRLDGVPTIRAGRWLTAASTPLSPRLAFELHRMHPDIVHLHAPYPVGELAALLATPTVPTVITYHSDIIRQRTLLRLYGPLLTLVLQRATRILVTSPAYLNSSPWMGPVRDHCAVIPLGIDLGPFTTIHAKGDGRTVLFVGRFRYYKGLPFLIEAIARIPEARLVLVGGGPAEEELRTLVTAMGLDDRVVFAVAQDNDTLLHYYSHADLFVLPACARSEAFGLVLVEAMASGLPCISTELGTGTSYVNEDGVTGVVVPPSDPDALAQAIRRLLADRALRERYAAAGRARARTLFDIRRVAYEVAEIYREIAAQR